MSRNASGLKAWVVQRATAVYLALFGSYLLLKFILDAPADHAELLAWTTTPWVTLGLLLFIPVTLSHAWVGIRDLYMDYIQRIGVRVVALTLTGFIFLASGISAVQAILVAQIA